MWRLYAGERKGVAVCSTVARMRTAIHPFKLHPSYGSEELWAGAVRYVDLSAVRLKLGSPARFFHKHIAFASEQEFRLAISLENAEENAVPVPTCSPQVQIRGDFRKLPNGGISQSSFGVNPFTIGQNARRWLDRKRGEIRVNL